MQVVTATPPASVSPVLVSPTVKPTVSPPSVEYKKTKVVSEDEQADAITRHNKEVYQYEQ